LVSMTFSYLAHLKSVSKKVDTSEYKIGTADTNSH
jgi:hypothetical protein